MDKLTNTELLKLKSSITSEIKFQMQKYKEAIKELTEEILLSEFVSAEVFQLPVIADGEENKEITKVPVTQLQGERALFEAVRSFKKVYAEEKSSKKAVYRLPGFIHIKGDKSKIYGLISKINEHKSLFQEEVQRIKGGKIKHDLVHESFPGLITKQFYRKLHMFDDDIASIGFCWARRFVIYKTTKKNIIKTIKKQQLRVPLHSNTAEWLAYIDLEIYQINQLPEAVKLRIKRPAKLSVIANIGTKNNRQISAHLPVILVQDKAFNITPLGDFDVAFQRCERSDCTIDGEPIIERLHLYAKAK